MRSARAGQIKNGPTAIANNRAIPKSTRRVGNCGGSNNPEVIAGVDIRPPADKLIELSRLRQFHEESTKTIRLGLGTLSAMARSTEDADTVGIRPGRGQKSGADSRELRRRDPAACAGV